MKSLMPPDGFADEPVSSGPPDGFADETITKRPPSLFKKAKDMYSKYENSTLYKASPVGMLNTANDLIRKGADSLAEKVATSPKLSFMGPTARGIAAGFVANAPDIAMTAAPLFTSKAPQALGFLERTGARGLNSSAGITPKTIMSMAKGANPAKFGEELGMSLYKEGAVGNSASSTFDKSKGILEKFGQDVGKALEDIKGSGAPIDVSADEALSPLFEKIKSLKESTFSSNRALARPFKEAYDKLWGSSINGRISLDKIREVMQETGEALGRAGEGTPKEIAYSELYGALANLRNKAVEKIAEMANNPSLAKNLINANQGYSKYINLIPDITKNAAKTAVKPLPGVGFDLGEPLKGLKAVQPMLSKAAIAVGKNASVSPNVAASVGIAAIPKKAPYGKIVQQDGVTYKWNGKEYVEQ